MRPFVVKKSTFAFMHNSETIIPGFTDMQSDWTSFAKSGDKPGNYGITLVDDQFHVIAVIARSQSGDPITWELTGKAGDLEYAASWALLLQHAYECEGYVEWKRRLNANLTKGGCRPCFSV